VFTQKSVNTRVCPQKIYNTSDCHERSAHKTSNLSKALEKTCCLGSNRPRPTPSEGAVTIRRRVVWLKTDTGHVNSYDESTTGRSAMCCSHSHTSVCYTHSHMPMCCTHSHISTFPMCGNFNIVCILLSAIPDDRFSAWNPSFATAQHWVFANSREAFCWWATSKYAHATGNFCTSYWSEASGWSCGTAQWTLQRKTSVISCAVFPGTGRLAHTHFNSFAEAK